MRPLLYALYLFAQFVFVVWTLSPKGSRCQKWRRVFGAIAVAVTAVALLWSMDNTCSLGSCECFGMCWVRVKCESFSVPMWCVQVYSIASSERYMLRMHAVIIIIFRLLGCVLLAPSIWIPRTLQSILEFRPVAIFIIYFHKFPDEMRKKIAYLWKLWCFCNWISCSRWARPILPFKIHVHMKYMQKAHKYIFVASWIRPQEHIEIDRYTCHWRWMVLLTCESPK